MDHGVKKRQNYRQAFHQFDPVRVAAMGDDDIERLLQDTGIIRHRGKIQAIIGNARAYLAMEENGESFTDFVWSFVDNAPQVTRAATLAEIPATTPASDALSKALKNAALSLSARQSVIPLCRPVGWSTTMSPAASVTLEVRMIRKWDTEDTAPLLALWLDSTIHAHPFISESYWRDSVAVVRDVYLPAASTWVWEQDGELKGFVSVLDSRFVGALFVAPGATRQGIGRALLDEVKQHYAWLSLEVYQKNESAVSFYHAQGFRIEDCAWQDDTQHPTWIMRWPADQMP